jgi:four helix bundle protein
LDAALGFTAQEGTREMAFQVEELAIELIEALQPLVSRIRARDRALADQLTRAASSVVLNIGERIEKQLTECFCESYFVVV